MLLDRDETASLFAAHELIADVAQQNHPLTMDDVLAFLRQKLHPTARRIWEDKDVGDGNTDPERPQLVAWVRERVQRERFLTIQRLMKALPDNLRTRTDSDVLAACVDIKEIKVHSSPGTTVLQWLP